MNSVTRKIAGAASAFMLAFTLAACGESDFDSARKPDLIEQVTENSLRQCNLSEPVDRDSNYETRLRAVLQDTQSKAIDVYLKKGASICLDSRLPQQVHGFWNQYIFGIFYNQAHPVVGLYDNGMVGSGTSMWHDDTSDYGADMLNKLADSIQSGDIATSDRLWLAGRYVHIMGKMVYTNTEWRASADFDTASQKANPQFEVPPLRPR